MEASSQGETAQGSSEAQLRRRRNTTINDTDAALEEDAAPLVTEKSGRPGEAKNGSQRPAVSPRAAPWSLLDGLTLFLLVAALLTALLLAPSFAHSYNAFTAQAAQHRVPVTLFTFVKEQMRLLPLPWRSAAAANANRLRLEQEGYERARASHTRDVRDAIDAEFARLADDPSYTRYASTRILFRPLPRKVYLSPEEAAKAAAETTTNAIATDAQGKPFVMTWGMAEIDPLRNTLDPARAETVKCAWDGRTRMKTMRITQAMATGVRIYTSYANARGEEGEGTVDLVSRGACLARVLELMCVGDKWEIHCPPEMSAANDIGEALSHRIDVRVVEDHVGSVASVEAELDYAARTLGVLERAPRELTEVDRQAMEAELAQLPRVTRATLLQKVLDHPATK